MHRFLAISLSTFLLTAPTFAQLAANTSIVGKVADVTGDRYRQVWEGGRRCTWLPSASHRRPLEMSRFFC